MFNEFLLPFEVSSLLLLSAMVGAVLLATKDPKTTLMESLFNTCKPVPLNHYIIVSAIIFSIGVMGVLIRRNAIVIFMSVELMLNSVNLLLTAFSVYRGDATGQVFVFFIMALGCC